MKRTKQRIKHELFHKKGNKKLPILFATAFGLLGVYLLATISATSTVNVTVNAKGTTGEETVQLKILDEVVDTWNLTNELCKLYLFS